MKIKKTKTLLKRMGLFSLVMALLLTGCSRNGKGENTSSDTETTRDTQSETTEAPTTTEADPEEPTEPVAVDESVCKIALIGISSTVGESKEDSKIKIPSAYEDGKFVSDWTGVTVWVYSFVMEGTTPKASWFEPDIFNTATGEELNYQPGKSIVIYSNGYAVYDIDQEYDSLYDVERDIRPIILYTTEEIPIENLEFRANMTLTPDGSEFGEAVLSVNSSIDDLSINPSMANNPLLKINDTIYLLSRNIGAGGGVGPDNTGDFEYRKFDILNLSDPFSEETISTGDIENLQYLNKETLEPVGPISGCYPIWDVQKKGIWNINYGTLRLGYYSDTKLPDWSEEDDPMEGYEKITINGSDIILH